MTGFLPDLVNRLNREEMAAGVAEADRSFAFTGDSQQRSVLLLHGAGGSPSDLRDLGADLRGRGHTSLCPLLPAHGLGPDRLASLRFADLVRSVLDSFDQLDGVSEKPCLVAQSLGAVLGIRLATQRKLAGFVALAPALRPRIAARALWLVPLALFNPRLARGTYRWQMELRRGIEETREHLSDVDCPLLVIHSTDDRSVSIRGARELHESARSQNKTLEIVHGQGHVLSEAPDRVELVFDPIARFLAAIAREAGIRRTDRHPGGA